MLEAVGESGCGYKAQLESVYRLAATTATVLGAVAGPGGYGLAP